MSYVDLCWLNKHTGSISTVVDFFLPCPTCHGLLAVIFVYKEGAGTLCSAAECVFIYFYRLHIMWSWKGLDEDLLLHLQANVGYPTALHHHFNGPRTPSEYQEGGSGNER